MYSYDSQSVNNEPLKMAVAVRIAEFLFWDTFWGTFLGHFLWHIFGTLFRGNFWDTFLGQFFWDTVEMI